MFDMISIGGGPIGLIAAIQMQLLFPEKKFLIFEKYEVPIRNHAMYIEQSSFAGMVRTKGFGELLDSIPSKVIISDLEKKLRAYAQSIGIEIQYREIKDFKALQQQYPDTNYFVGSGGLKGIIHPQVFKGEDQINESLRYAVEVKYKAHGKPRALNKLIELPGVLAHTQHVVSEYVGHLKDEETPISLRIFIDEPTYQSMKNATFKNPYTLADKDKIPSTLFETIQTYLNSRELFAEEIIKENSLKISTITLSIYASANFCKQINGKTIFQIGEEAFACPFYRSFNDNASCIPSFTKSMSALFLKENVKSHAINPSLFFSSSISSFITEEDPLSYYEHQVQKLVNSEIGTIYCLNFGLDLLETSAASSRAIPQLSASKLNFTSTGKTFLEEEKRRHYSNKAEEKSSSSCIIL